jgi:hypothetical protein
MGKDEKQVPRWLGWLVALVAAALAGFSARPYAGSWNDGSRLATVECLVDEHTLAIDHSVFVDVPRPPLPVPYPPREVALREHGTGDKLFIHGRYYSDKSPVPAVLIAGVYQAWEWLTGRTARTDPEEFCRVMTLASSGLSYVLAVVAVYVLGGRLRLSLPRRLLLTGSLALATVALPYARQVNSHILLLAVTSWMVVDVAGLAEVGASRWRLLRLGVLAGLGYTFDLGAGPVILVCTTLLVIFRCRRLGGVAMFALAALPCLALHHALNYRIGGCWRPANSVPEYLAWPGSPFTAQNMTGGWLHSGLGSFLLYASSMLFGKRGFLGHNLPLFLVLRAAWIVLKGWRKRPEVVWAVACCGGTWLLYAAASNNSSGLCLSIRWFVPLLAPAFFVIAVWLEQFPRFWMCFGLLSAIGFLQMLLMGEGPWSAHMVPAFWFLQAAALVALAAVWRLRERPNGSKVAPQDLGGAVLAQTSSSPPP